jgi:hypothetical protein
MEPEGSLQHSQDPATCPCPEHPCNEDEEKYDQPFFLMFPCNGAAVE